MDKYKIYVQILFNPKNFVFECSNLFHIRIIVIIYVIYVEMNSLYLHKMCVFCLKHYDIILKNIARSVS